MKKHDTQNNWFERNAKVNSVQEIESILKGRINPPPEDCKCMCCGRPLSDLRPFGGFGDPLPWDFDGAFLVKKYRNDAPYDKKVGELVDEILTSHECDIENLHEYLVNKHGEDGDRIYWQAALQSTVSKSWECRDCAVLDDYKYWDVRMKSMKEGQ